MARDSSVRVRDGVRIAAVAEPGGPEAGVVAEMAQPLRYARLVVDLPAHLAERLTAAKEREGIPATRLVRAALRAWLDANEGVHARRRG